MLMVAYDSPGEGTTGADRATGAVGHGAVCMRIACYTAA